MTPQALRSRYVQDTVATVTPARLLTMLYDALVRDLVLAEAALDLGNLAEASDRLLHAQDIIFELQASLDVEKWASAAGLAQVYAFLVSELVAANIRKDPERVASCRRLVEPLRDAWHAAARQVGAAE